MGEEEKKNQSLKDQAKEIWSKIAWAIWKWWKWEKEFTFWVSKEAYLISLLLLIVSIWAFGMAVYYAWLKNEELIAKTRELKELN